MSEARTILIDPLIDNNPVTLQMLGICSALAVTTSLLPALLMCVALTSVAALSGAAISALRNRIPNNIRISGDYALGALAGLRRRVAP